MKRETVNKIPSVLCGLKTFGWEKSYASEAVRAGGALGTANQFFKVTASVREHPDLSE